MEPYAQLAEHFRAIAQIYKHLSGGGGPVHLSTPVRKRKNLSKLGISNFPTYDELIKLQKAIKDGDSDTPQLLQCFSPANQNSKHAEHVIQLFTKAYQHNGGRFLDHDEYEENSSSDSDGEEHHKNMGRNQVDLMHNQMPGY